MASAKVPQPQTAPAVRPSLRPNRCFAVTAGLSSQWLDMSLRHHQQAPHAGVTDASTRSPGLTRLTSRPVSSTIPQPSWPGTIGRLSADLPSMTLRSVWQMPEALTRTRTSRGPMAGTGRSSRTSGWPASYATATFIPHPLPST